MSYKSREKKRKYKAATAKSRRDQRENHADRHYLTIVRRPCSCNDPGCGRPLRSGVEAVFRFSPKEILCLQCADRRRIKYRPSLRWEEAKGKRKKRR